MEIKPLGSVPLRESESVETSGQLQGIVPAAALEAGQRGAPVEAGSKTATAEALPSTPSRRGEMPLQTQLIKMKLADGVGVLFPPDGKTASGLDGIC
jgi:hypothetical protein